MNELWLIAILFGLLAIGTVGIAIFLLYIFSKEVDRKDFFTIKIEGWNLRNLLINLMISPVYWFIQVGIIIGFSLLLLAFMLEVPYYTTGDALLTFFAAGSISLAATLLYATIIWLLDYNDREPLKIFPTLFLWGCMAAIIAFFLNTMIDAISYIILPEIILLFFIPTVVAPVVEEFFKGIGLFVISRHKQFSGILDGIVFGFIVGMGFAFIEDWAYYTQYGPIELGVFEWIQFVFLRSILTGATHGILTAVTGIFLGIASARKSKVVWLWLAAGLLVAMGLHGVFNALSFVDAIIFILTGVETPILIGFMMALLLGLALLIKKGMDEYNVPKKIRAKIIKLKSKKRSKK